ncbi:MAG: hypothetical protein JO250_05315 [Armatimonadetes bacterium]|nr:hypothetical protein [Armatimonadota bacterium]
MRDELQQIRQVLEEQIGRPSRWSGILEITSDPAVRGAKPFRCDIVLNESLAGQDVRWRTLIHEMLHTFSAGYNRTDFDQFPGWEEGVVEQCQRLLRPSLLAALGVRVDEAVFQEVEATHLYNKYIDALEQIRAHLSMEAEAFYLGLLAVPIRLRKGFAYGMGAALSGEERRRYWDTCSQGSAVLKEKL